MMFETQRLDFSNQTTLLYVDDLDWLSFMDTTIYKDHLGSKDYVHIRIFKLKRRKVFSIDFALV